MVSTAVHISFIPLHDDYNFQPRVSMPYLICESSVNPLHRHQVLQGFRKYVIKTIITHSCRLSREMYSHTETSVVTPITQGSGRLGVALKHATNQLPIMRCSGYFEQIPSANYSVEQSHQQFTTHSYKWEALLIVTKKVKPNSTT